MSGLTGDKIPEIVTAPRDVKNFPATNQSHYCWSKYNEFVLCMKKTNGEGSDKCTDLRRLAKTLCLDEWVQQWDEQREAGKFLGVQENPKLAKHH